MWVPKITAEDIAIDTRKENKYVNMAKEKGFICDSQYGRRRSRANTNQLAFRD